MRCLSRFLITLPLLAGPFSGLAHEVKAEAVMTQLDALRLLAKSRAADGKCKILSAGEAEELNGYLARAEIAAASRNSVSEVQSTMSLGKVLGDTASCSPATRDEIGATLAAARQAMAAAKDPRPAEQEAETVESPFPTARRKTGVADERPRTSLAAYGRHAFAYYVERRCEYLSRREIRRFWMAVIREHRAALGAFGRAAVAGTLRRARSQAERVGCDAAGRRLVQSEYVKLARN